MAIIINGSGTVTGLSVGGLPDGTVDAGTLATDSVTSAKILDATIASGDLASGVAGAGKVLQVVQAVRNTNFSSSATSYIDTGLSGTITPSSTSSKILVLVSQQGFHAGGAADVSLNIVRDTTQIAEIYYQHKPTNQAYMANQIQYLDSPSTTSSITYKTQARNTQARTLYFSWGSTGNAYITLMEIGA